MDLIINTTLTKNGSICNKRCIELLCSEYCQVGETSAKISYTEFSETPEEDFSSLAVLPKFLHSVSFSTFDINKKIGKEQSSYLSILIPTLPFAFSLHGFGIEGRKEVVTVIDAAHQNTPFISLQSI